MGAHQIIAYGVYDNDTNLSDSEPELETLGDPVRSDGDDEDYEKPLWRGGMATPQKARRAFCE